MEVKYHMNKNEIWAQMKALANKDGGLTEADVDKYRKLESQLDVQVTHGKLNDLRSLGESGTVSENDALVRSDEKLAKSNNTTNLDAVMEAIVTSNQSKLTDEQRALVGGTDSAGGFLIPDELSNQLLDLARAKSTVFQAGATTVPMKSDTLKVVKVATDPVPAWRAESVALPETDPAFALVTFSAKTLGAVTKISREAMADATVNGGLGSTVVQLFAKAFATELDRVVLLGDPSGGGDADEPEGILYNTTIAAAAVDAVTAYADYDPLVDAVYAVKQANYEPSAVIGSVRTERDLAKLKTGISGDLTSLTAPAVVSAIPRLSSTAVPINLGTAESVDFIGQFSEVWVGVRNNLEITVLNERYADTGEIGLVGWLRADVQITQEAAFQLIDGIVV